MNLEIESRARVLNDDLHEVVLTLTATAKVSDKTAYLAEVHQSGIFLMQGLEDAELQRLHNVYCLRTLYPYGAAALSELVLKGGFPSLLPAPVNFDALYQQRLQAAQADGEQKAVMMLAERAARSGRRSGVTRWLVVALVLAVLVVIAAVVAAFFGVSVPFIGD